MHVFTRDLPTMISRGKQSQTPNVSPGENKNSSPVTRRNRRLDDNLYGPTNCNASGCRCDDGWFPHETPQRVLCGIAMRHVVRSVRWNRAIFFYVTQLAPREVAKKIKVPPQPDAIDDLTPPHGDHRVSWRRFKSMATSCESGTESAPNLPEWLQLPPRYFLIG